jgi:hypothetical protein
VSEDRTADYEIRGLEGRAADLQKSGLLSSARDTVEDISTTLGQLPGRLQEARTRGYVFKSYLEEQLASLQDQWRPLQRNIVREIERRSRELADELEAAERAVRRLAPYKGRPLQAAQSTINRVESELDSAERKVQAATDAVGGMYDAIYADMWAASREVDACFVLLDLMDQASFGFRPGEAGVAAVKAKWLKDGRKEGPRGILFLTDQRLVFEQREKVATKKVLFIRTASEEVQELQWEAPLGALTEAEASEQRRALVVKKEHLTLEFKPPATIREVIMELGEDSETWRALINRVLSGEIDRERVEGAREASAAEAAAVQVPTNCPNCNAKLDVTVTRGMTAIKCTFCGTSVPLQNAI